MSRKRVVGRTGARFGSAAMRETWEGAESEEDLLPPDEDDSITELSGARFGSPSLRRRWKREAERAREPVETEALQPVPPPPEPGSEPTELIEARPVPLRPLPETEWDEPPASLIRPYAHTAGRTRARRSLPLEALISATGRCPLDDRPPEWRTIAGLCAAPRSVAEISATLSIPVGVARVLISDMADSDAVTAHDTAGGGGPVPDHALMQRVLEGLRRL
ncbi:DUF742 domain-containing protein [Saccharopolyspora sp. TS4A08]|uniref:DUF742 domain-containing protein n=1 Tax=Saccharopolyspora ipomoeae TaxID=3042027 RepID=A0ABT6PNF6_9PSEU|nr:DUF742 domain-containing protein [Saccharopolyspora sp. TS4A08]MDI2028976.1 DUF742 domain-containing protein [Saccharopolyspora sp. TS4A08]